MPPFQIGGCAPDARVVAELRSARRTTDKATFPGDRRLPVIATGSCMLLERGEPSFEVGPTLDFWIARGTRHQPRSNL